MKTLILALLVLTASNSLALTPSAPATEKRWQSVVLLKIPATDTDGQVVEGLCVGTLVSADTLVTAAHCLAGSTLARGGQITIEVGEYQFLQKPDGTPYRTGYMTTIRHQSTVQAHFVGGVGYDSAPNRIAPENDFTFIKLNTAMILPADFIFAALWNKSIQGVILSNPLSVSINPIEYITSNDTKQFAQLNQIRFLDSSAQSTSTSRVAPGDSGAPLFAAINGQVYLIGVTKGLATSFFSKYDVFAIWGSRSGQPAIRGPVSTEFVTQSKL